MADKPRTEIPTPVNHPQEASYTPLLIDRVMQGQSFNSEAPLLQLLIEIMSQILHIFDEDDKKTLASLALVNSDCRQLAYVFTYLSRFLRAKYLLICRSRSRQFERVVLLLNDRAHALL